MLSTVVVFFLLLKTGFAFRQRDIDISDMENCLFEKHICRRTNECKVDLWFQPDYLFLEDCSSSLGTQFVLCDECWLNFDNIAIKVLVEGVSTKQKQLLFREIIRYSIKQWCPEIGCSILKFKPWDANITSKMFFSNISRNDIVYLDDLIGDKFYTKLTVIKKVKQQTALGAVHPHDVIKVLELPSVKRFLKDNTIKVTYHPSRIVEEKQKNKNNEENSKDQITTNDSLNARVLVLILFSVVLFAVFLSIFMFRKKNLCCRDPPLDSIGDIENDDSAENVHGVDLFIRPPPYTTEDEYKNKNPPPSYSDITS